MKNIKRKIDASGKNFCAIIFLNSWIKGELSMKLNKKLLFSSAVIVGLLLSVAPATVQAASTASSAPKTTNVNPKAVIENDPKLTKQGYVLRIKNSKAADPI